MVTSPLIEAHQLVPDRPGEPMPPLELTIDRPGCSCMLADSSERLAHYIRTLSGLEHPRAGSLSLLGVEQVGLDHESWSRLRQSIGFVTYGTPLLSVLSAIDNIALPALYHKTAQRSEALTRGEAMLAQLGFDGDIHQLPAYLTPLQRLQVAIVRSVITEPQLLLLEEPFAGLFDGDRERVLPFLRHWSERHHVVIATRQSSVVKALRPAVLFLAEDAIHYFDNWENFIESDEPVIRRYIEKEQRNCLLQDPER